MSVKYRFIWSFVFCLVGGAAFGQDGGAPSPSSPTFFESGWTDNLRWSVDSSAQQWLNSKTDQWLDQYVVGLDLHKVFSTSRGDIGTLILQPYVVWLPGDRPRPYFFEGNEAALTWRIANFNLAVLPRGRLNVRFGHFEFPFGLEHEINTNGTLRQYGNGANLGGKADWGTGVNGQFSNWQYEVAVTRGTGQEYHSSGDPYAFSARVGTPFDRSVSVGVASFRGRIEGPTGLVERERIGVDARWARGPVGLMAEASTGKDFDDDVRSWLAEFNWTSGTESLLTYLQLRRHEVARAVDGRSADIVGFGVRWLLSNQITLAAQLNHEIRRFDPGLDANELRLHFRFRL